MLIIRRRSLSCVTLCFVLCSLLVVAAAQASITTVATGGTNPFGIAVNPVTNKVYISNYGSANATVVDGYHNTPSLVAVDSNPEGVAVNTVTNKIYVADYGANLVTVIDGASSNTASVETGRRPTAIAVNKITDLVYVTNNVGNSVTVIDGSDNNVVATVPTGAAPCAVAINDITNKIYVANCTGGNVTVIDGATNNHTLVTVGSRPDSIAINTQTNQIYVANSSGQRISVIDGNTNDTSFVTTGNDPTSVAVNEITNRAFAANQGSDSVTVIDGASNTVITNVPVGSGPTAVAVNPVTNQIYVSNSTAGHGSISIIDGASDTVTQTFSLPSASPRAIAINPVTNRIYFADFNNGTFSVVYYSNSINSQFVAVPPCRLIDTRNTGGPITGNTSRNFNVPSLGGCNIPSTATAYSLNVTAVPHGRLGFLTIWPTGQERPVVSTMNSLDGRIKANAAIVQSGYLGDVSVYVNNTSDVLLDIDGYFTTPGPSTLQFYPLTPCRVVDTRNTNGDLGGPFLNANQERDFPVLESNCLSQVSGAVAYSFNVTAVPNPSGQRLGFLTVWPKGEPQPPVSTLNNPTGTIVANAAIVPAGGNGAIAVFPNNTTDLLIDVNGYFAAPGTGLSLYPIAPCRVIDTRGPDDNQPPFGGELTVNVGNTSANDVSPCPPPSAAQAYVLNATVVPPAPLGYLTLWPDGLPKPNASTLNATDGAITSNMAIVPTSNSYIDAYANALTQLLLDMSSFFRSRQFLRVSGWGWVVLRLKSPARSVFGRDFSGRKMARSKLNVATAQEDAVKQRVMTEA